MRRSPRSASSCSRSRVGPGAVVLADRLHGARVVEQRAVGGQRRRAGYGRRAAEPERAHVEIEERAGVAARSGALAAARAGRGTTSASRRARAARRRAPNLAGRDDVEHREPRHARRGDRAPSGRRRGPPVVSGDGEAVVSRARSSPAPGPGHAPLAVWRVIRHRAGLERLAVAGQVGGNDGERLGSRSAAACHIRCVSADSRAAAAAAGQRPRRGAKITPRSVCELALDEVLEHGLAAPPASPCRARARRKAVAWAIAARVALASLIASSSMKSWTTPS